MHLRRLQHNQMLHLVAPSARMCVTAPCVCVSPAVKWFCGVAALRWSPLLVSCGWVRPLKASCQRLARRHDAEESLTFIGHFPFNFPLNHTVHPLLFLSSPSPIFTCFIPPGRFSSFGPSRPFSPRAAQTPLFPPRLFSVSVIRRSIRTSALPPLHLLLLRLPPCQAASPLSPPAPALSSVPSSLPAHSVSGPRRPEGRYISRISDWALLIATLVKFFSERGTFFLSFLPTDNEAKNFPARPPRSWNWTKPNETFHKFAVSVPHIQMQNL